MICEDCQVAVYMLEEDDSDPAVLSLARMWHRKCLNWRGRNRRGCECEHIL